MTITYDDAGRLLALAAARDQRTVGDSDVLAWQADLAEAGITAAEAEAALTHYYAVQMPRMAPEQRRRISPTELIAIALRQRKQRLANFHYEPADPDETPAEYLERLRAQLARCAAGEAAGQQLALPQAPQEDADLPGGPW